MKLKLIFLIFFWQRMTNCVYQGCDEEARKWCEQSQCSTGCKCENKSVCKQVCTTEQCPELQCSSNKVCTQSVIPPTNNNIGQQLVTTVHIQNMIARAPNIEQSCPLGICDTVTALKMDGQISKALQVCNGRCNKILSNVDYTRQLAVQTDLMQCVNTTVCDQVCVIGGCQMMYCNSNVCKQRCSVGSQCKMTCGPNTKICHQTCEMDSKCQIACLGQNCTRQCKDAELCEILKSNQMFEKKTTNNSTSSSAENDISNNSAVVFNTTESTNLQNESYLGPTSSGYSEKLDQNKTENRKFSNTTLKIMGRNDTSNNATALGEEVTSNQTDHKKEMTHRTEMPSSETETDSHFIVNTTSFYHLVNESKTTNISTESIPKTHLVRNQTNIPMNITTSQPSFRNYSELTSNLTTFPTNSINKTDKLTSALTTSVYQKNITATTTTTRKTSAGTTEIATNSRESNSLNTSTDRKTSPVDNGRPLTTMSSTIYNTSSKGNCLKSNTVSLIYLSALVLGTMLL